MPLAAAIHSATAGAGLDRARDGTGPVAGAKPGAGHRPLLQMRANDRTATPRTTEGDHMSASNSRREALKSVDFHRLVSAARVGEHPAITSLLTQLRPELVRYCSNKIRHDVAEDVVQDICLAVFHALPRYTGRPEDFLSFVYGIAGHKVADWYRRRERDRSDAVADVAGIADRYQVAGPSVEDRACQAALLAWLRPVLNELPGSQRSVFVLRLLCGLTYAEIGAKVGGSDVAARVAHHRARKALQAEAARFGA